LLGTSIVAEAEEARAAAYRLSKINQAKAKAAAEAALRGDPAAALALEALYAPLRLSHPQCVPLLGKEDQSD
jgi:hypothetical protein